MFFRKPNFWTPCLVCKLQGLHGSWTRSMVDSSFSLQDLGFAWFMDCILVESFSGLWAPGFAWFEDLVRGVLLVFVCELPGHMESYKCTRNPISIKNDLDSLAISFALLAMPFLTSKISCWLAWYEGGHEILIYPGSNEVKIGKIHNVGSCPERPVHPERGRWVKSLSWPFI